MILCFFILICALLPCNAPMHFFSSSLVCSFFPAPLCRPCPCLCGPQVAPRPLTLPSPSLLLSPLPEPSCLLHLRCPANLLGRFFRRSFATTTTMLCGLNLDAVRQLKSQRTRLAARAQKVRNEFEQLLDDDNDMAELYLSRKLAGASSHGSGSGTGGAAASQFVTSHTTGSKMSTAGKASIVTVRRDEDDVEKVEMLLELREYIDDTKGYINIRLENHRNQLMQVVIFSGVFVTTYFALIVAHARHKGLLG